jgi:hypothetical protein
MLPLVIQPPTTGRVRQYILPWKDVEERNLGWPDILFSTESYRVLNEALSFWCQGLNEDAR